jgi:hypothetical protein
MEIQELREAVVLGLSKVVTVAMAVLKLFRRGEIFLV